MYVHVRGENPAPAHALSVQAATTPKYFEHAGLGNKRSMRCNLVLYKKPKSKKPSVPQRGLCYGRYRHRKAQKRERGAWVLATSLSSREFTGRAIVKIYAKRMQIEKSFRDLKCVRHGCAFDQSLTRSCARLSMLLLIHALATFVAWLKGLTLDNTDATIKHGGVFAPRARRHYSLLRLGWEALRYRDPDISSRSLYGTLRNWYRYSELGQPYTP
jgi:hypothetical protein